MRSNISLFADHAHAAERHNPRGDQAGREGEEFRTKQKNSAAVLSIVALIAATDCYCFAGGILI